VNENEIVSPDCVVIAMTVQVSKFLKAEAQNAKRKTQNAKRKTQNAKRKTLNAKPK
jgi:hypothetical protein